MNTRERNLINHLQGGFPITERPYLQVANRLGMTEEDVISGIQSLLESGKLTRFGPLYHAERIGGDLTLAAMKLPTDDLDRVSAIVNGFPEVAHNYERDHEFNMWFVVATDDPGDVPRVLAQIEESTGHTVFNMPKQNEYYVGLRFDV